MSCLFFFVILTIIYNSKLRVSCNKIATLYFSLWLLMSLLAYHTKIYTPTVNYSRELSDQYTRNNGKNGYDGYSFTGVYSSIKERGPVYYSFIRICVSLVLFSVIDNRNNRLGIFTDKKKRRTVV